jgi:hypothetical protein
LNIITYVISFARQKAKEIFAADPLAGILEGQLVFAHGVITGHPGQVLHNGECDVGGQRFLFAFEM